MEAHLSNYCVQHSLSRATCDALIDAISGAWDSLHQFSYLQIDDESAAWSVVPSSPLEIATSVCSYLTRTAMTMPSTQRDSCMMTLKLEFSRTMAWLEYRQHDEDSFIKAINAPSHSIAPPKELHRPSMPSREHICHTSQMHDNHTIHSALATASPWPVCLANEPPLDSTRDTKLATPSRKPILPTEPSDLLPEPDFHSQEVVTATTKAVIPSQHKSNQSHQDQQNSTPPTPTPTLRRTRPKEVVARRGLGSLTVPPPSLPPTNQAWSTYLHTLFVTWIMPLAAILGATVVYLRAREAHAAQLESLQDDNQKLQASLEQLSAELQESIARTDALYQDQAAKAIALENTMATLTQALDELRAAKANDNVDTLVPTSPFLPLPQMAADQLSTGTNSVLLHRLSGSLAVDGSADVRKTSPFRMAAASIMALGLRNQRASSVEDASARDVVVA